MSDRSLPDYQRVLFLILLLAASIGGIYYQFSYSINPDSAVLMEFARRFLEGGRFGVDFFDVNPPLSILIYVPAVLLGGLTGLPAYYSVVVYILALSVLSAALTWKTLRSFPFLGKEETDFTAAAFFLSGLYVTNIFFGERDHIIALGLMPLLLTQFAIAKSCKIPRAVFYTSCVFGAVVILIKPHYGLMPAMMLLHRAWKEKSPGALLRADFIIITAALAAYALLCITMFYDFTLNDLPDAVRLYATRSSPGLANTLMPAMSVFALLMIASALSPLTGEKKSIALMLTLASFCLLIAFVTQIKGYYYHIIPAYMFMLTTLVLLGTEFAKTGLPKLVFTIAAPAALLLVFPASWGYPTHAGYKELPMAKMLENCPEPCTFFAVNEFAFMVYETAVYKNATHASRFPSLWFQPPLTCGYAAVEKNYPGVMSREKLDHYFNKYTAMMADDIDRYKPSLIAIIRSDDACPDGSTMPFDFVSFFSKHPGFKAAWGNYKFDKEFSFDRRDYFAGTSADFSHMMTFDIYRRQEP